MDKIESQFVQKDQSLTSFENVPPLLFRWGAVNRKFHPKRLTQ
jgi:hypothetical protein